ncbi:MAG: hypothetical protein ACYCPT_12490 [Acidimicrobiales bacterium]
MDAITNADPQPEPPRKGGRLTGVEALKTHAMLVFALVLCGAAFWFELGRAERGNHLSWAYVFEWPLLGLFAIYMWWKFMHPDGTTSRSPKPSKPAVAPQFEGMLAAWQEHQRELAKEQEEERREELQQRDDAP